MNTDKILRTFRNAVSRGQTELAAALYETLKDDKSSECEEIKAEATKIVLKCESGGKLFFHFQVRKFRIYDCTTCILHQSYEL